LAARCRSCARSVISFRREPRSPLDKLDNRIYFRVAQWRDEAFGRLASDSIDLDQFQLAASRRNLVEPIAKRFQLGLARWLAVDSHEQRLNDQRPHFRGSRDVVEDLLKWNRRAIDEPEVFGCAGFELGPDFAVVLIEDFQA